MSIKDTIYMRFYHYISQRLRKRIFILVPLLSLAGLLEVVSLAALIPLMSFILDSSNDIFIFEFLGLEQMGSSEKVLILFLIYLFLMILKGFFSFLTIRYSLSTVMQITGELKEHLYSGYLYRSFIKHLECNSANYLRNITTECNQIEGRFIMPSIAILVELLPVLLIGLFLFYINPEGILVAIAIFFISGFSITKLTSSILKKYGKEQLFSDGMQMKVAKETFTSLKEINLYNRQRNLIDIYSLYVDTSQSLIVKAITLGQLPKIILEIIGIIVIAIVAFISFAKGGDVNSVIVELTIFMGAIIKLLPSANRIVTNIQSLTHARPALENILNELDSMDEDKNKANKYEKEVESLNNIILKGLSLKYTVRDSYVFESINFQINKGEIIGLMGESGTGKSTLINLLLGFIKPTKGSISINGINMNECLSSWKSKVSYVPQDVVLFEDTLKNNILFYDDVIDDNYLKSIISNLKLDSLVESLPEGINTILSENGDSLSGGQKQRIGIARALARKPEFIIFDEATSALDIETEDTVNKYIKRISLHCTVLIIAHKKSALEICDKVYKISNKNLNEITLK